MIMRIVIKKVLTNQETGNIIQEKMIVIIKYTRKEGDTDGIGNDENR